MNFRRFVLYGRSDEISKHHNNDNDDDDDDDDDNEGDDDGDDKDYVKVQFLQSKVTYVFWYIIQQLDLQIHIPPT